MIMSNKKDIKRISLGKKIIEHRFGVDFSVRYEDIKDKVTPVKYDIYSSKYGRHIAVKIVFYFEVEINDVLEKLFVFDARFFSDKNVNDLILVREYDDLVAYEKFDDRGYKKYQRNMNDLVEKLGEKNSVVSYIDAYQIKKDVMNHINGRLKKEHIQPYSLDDEELINISRTIDYNHLFKEIDKIKGYAKHFDIEPVLSNIIDCYFLLDYEYEIESKDFFLIFELREVTGDIFFSQKRNNFHISLGKDFIENQVLVTYEISILSDGKKNIREYERVIGYIDTMKRHMSKAVDEVKKMLESLTLIR
jgi:hypothetical protein